MRIVHVTPHPVQYYAPLYRTIARTPGVDLVVLYGSAAGVRSYHDRELDKGLSWDVDLLGGYRSIMLKGLEIGSRGRQVGRGMHPEVVTWMLRLKPDVAWVNGYTVPDSLLAAAAAFASRIPVLLRDDANLLKNRPRRRELFRRLALAPMLRRCVCCYVGSQNRRYYEHYGVAASNLRFVPHSVDNAFFRCQHARCAPQRTELRRALGVTDDRPVLLAVGKLVPGKDPMALVRAFARVAETTSCHLVFCGDGPLKPEIQALANRLAPGRVTITGFVNQSEIGVWYSCADLLVVASRAETWGLVVNEAMNFALPAVVSDRVGCASDLIVQGQTGAVFRAGDEDDLVQKLQCVLEGGRLREMGLTARDLIARWDVQSTADGLVAAARTAAASGPN